MNVPSVWADSICRDIILYDVSIFFVSCLHCECYTHMYCSSVTSWTPKAYTTHIKFYPVYFSSTQLPSLVLPYKHRHTLTWSLSPSLSLSVSYYSCWFNITQVYWICQLEFVIYHDQIISKSIAIQILPLQTRERQPLSRKKRERKRGTHSKV